MPACAAARLEPAVQWALPALPLRLQSLGASGSGCPRPPPWFARGACQRLSWRLLHPPGCFSLFASAGTWAGSRSSLKTFLTMSAFVHRWVLPARRGQGGQPAAVASGRLGLAAAPVGGCAPCQHLAVVPCMVCPVLPTARAPRKRDTLTPGTLLCPPPPPNPPPHTQMSAALNMMNSAVDGGPPPSSWTAPQPPAAAGYGAAPAPAPAAPHYDASDLTLRQVRSWALGLCRKLRCG